MSFSAEFNQADISSVDPEQLKRLASMSSVPIVCMLYLPYCGACKRTKPLFIEFKKRYGTQVKCVALDADKYEDYTVQELKIIGYPTLIAFKPKSNVPHKLEERPFTPETIVHSLKIVCNIELK